MGVSPPLLGLVGIGDSKTHGQTCCYLYGGYQPYLANYTDGYFLGSLGLDGASTSAIKAGTDAFLATISGTPAWVIVDAGTNDLISPPSEASFESDYAYILDAVHTKWPSAQVLCVKAWWNGGATVDANAITMAGWVDNVMATRAWTVAIFEKDFLNASLLESNGIHPNSAGYNVIGRQAATAIGY